MTYNTSDSERAGSGQRQISSNYPLREQLTQEKHISNSAEISQIVQIPAGRRILALDLGMKRIGVAVSDESQTVARPINRIERTSWKKVLASVKELLSEFDAAALVIGLPLNFDGTESEMSAEARRLARNFALSLDVPVMLQDERATSYAAKKKLWELGVDLAETRKLVDSEAAAVILSDVLDRLASVRSSNSPPAEK